MIERCTICGVIPEPRMIVKWSLCPTWYGMPENRIESLLRIGEPIVPNPQRYHVVWASVGRRGDQEKAICGLVEDASEQEEYLNWLKFWDQR